MAGKELLKRGFKAKCERLALDYRSKLSIHVCNPLCAFKLAEYLNIPIYRATEFLTSPIEKEKLANDNFGWSALTMVTSSGNRIIIINPYHSDARQQSDIMHELAHVICGHKQSFSNYDFEIPLGMRHFDEIQEEEAICLGSTLQITRPGLLWALKRNYTVEQISSYFNSSIEMAKYRMQISGVIKQ
ncbi:MAG: ImmA/IrrE family metallo-endopeptidase, partial [Mucilaginibacter sp.]|nr:ImmA/IrrE family metallo-endopeptidase [Mucilaginibacter sp.]